MGESRRWGRAVVRVLGGAGLVLLVVGGLGLSAGSAVAAGTPAAGGHVLTEPLVVVDAVPSPTCPTDSSSSEALASVSVTCPTTIVSTSSSRTPHLGTATVRTTHVAPTAVAAGLDAGSTPPGSAWPGWTLLAGLALVGLAGVLFSAFAERGRRQA